MCIYVCFNRAVFNVFHQCIYKVFCVCSLAINFICLRVIAVFYAVDKRSIRPHASIVISLLTTAVDNLTFASRHPQPELAYDTHAPHSLTLTAQTHTHTRLREF